MRWKEAWKGKFRTAFCAGFIILILILAFFPVFFQWIEKRKGITLHDPLLAALPAYDLSIPIFILIWSMTILILVRCIQSPLTCFLFLWGYIFLCLSRMLTLALVPLAPPVGLIELKDPLTNIFYGGKFIATDLFYSGHTATQFLIFLCLSRRTDKLIALSSTIAIIIMLLLQHVHYTIDIGAALLFSFLVYRAARSFTYMCTSM